MKKTMLIGTVVVLAFMLGLATLYAQPMGPGMTGQDGGWRPGYGPQQQGGWYCSGGGSRGGQGWGRGPGMMRQGWRYGYGMYPGNKGQGYRMGQGMMGPGSGRQYQQPQNPPGR